MILFLIFAIYIGLFFYLGVRIIANTVFCCFLLSIATHAIGVELGAKKFRRYLYFFLPLLLIGYLFISSSSKFIDPYFFIGSSPPFILGIILGWVIFEKTSIPYSSILSNPIGTSFSQADLTGAVFSNACLGNTDICKAIIINTSWIGAKNIEYMHPLTSYLKHSMTRELAITGKGENKVYDYLDLNGIYLKKAELANASFVDANLSKSVLTEANLCKANLFQSNLSEADLSEANLIDANLTQAQLADANLSIATLTGACIEDWNITTHTCLENVICEYVFMKNVPLGSNEDRYRKPDHWGHKFAEGDFSDFIKPLTNTLDLYHNRNIDPRSIAVAYKRLRKKYPEADLHIIALESRGIDKLLFRVYADKNADRSELNGAYFADYDEIQDLSSIERLKIWQSELSSGKDSEIQFLQKTVLMLSEAQKSNSVEVNIMPKSTDRSLSINGENMQGFIIQSGDNSKVSFDFKKVNLPAPNDVNIYQELAELKQVLGQLDSVDARKIKNALEDVGDELQKEDIDKDEVGKALERALDYAKKTQGFVEIVDKLRPHIQKFVGWLGENWHRLLILVGLTV